VSRWIAFGLSHVPFWSLSDDLGIKIYLKIDDIDGIRNVNQVVLLPNTDTQQEATPFQTS
jgi:hypothetical protein